MSPSSHEKDVLALSQRKWQEMTAHNVDWLGDLFHNEAVIVHMGATHSKQQELDAISSGSMQYQEVDVHETTARSFSGTVLVWTKFDLSIIVNGNASTSPFVTTEVFVRGIGDEPDWLLASLSFTRLITPSA